MTYEEIMSKLSEMRSRYDDGFSSEDRDLLEYLHGLLFNKRISITGCSDCYRDAYIIITNKLKKLQAMPKSSIYQLKKGCLLHEAGSADWYVNDVPEEVAEAYLKKFPHKIALFQKYPEDWEERIAGEKKPTDEELEAQAEAELKAAEEAVAKAEAEAAAQAEAEKPTKTTKSTKAKTEKKENPLFD